MQRSIISAAVVIHCEEQQQDGILPPSDIIREYVDEAIEACGMQSLFGTRKRGGYEDFGAPAKRKMVKYNRIRAKKCVYEDWMRTTPPPIFDDKQFERTFRLKRAMIDYLVGHLANNDSFWTSTIDACGKESIDPYVKFLSGQKMVCYGVSWSAFRDYFQMGESTARLCMSKLCRGIYDCDEITDIYLRSISKADVR